MPIRCHHVPPTLFFNDTDSLGERIQRAFPPTRVVKSMNTANLMVRPDQLPGGPPRSSRATDVNFKIIR